MQEEERRLLYVAMTRAKDELVLMLPWQVSARQSAFAGAAATRSHFIGDNILKRFDRNRNSGSRSAAAPSFVHLG